MAQFTVVRIGDALLGTVPFEATTTVGARMRDAMREAAGTTEPPRRVMVLGLANNYIGYVPTLLEYQQQYYEGGSALYGPASAQVYTGQLAGLTRELAASGWTSDRRWTRPRRSRARRGRAGPRRGGAGSCAGA